jgi:hypothetical protein
MHQSPTTQENNAAMMMIRLLVLVAVLGSGSAAAEDGPRCDDRFADASAQYRDALYQSDPQHRDGAAAKVALAAFRGIWDDIIDRWIDCLPRRHAADEEMAQRLHGIAEVAATAMAQALRDHLDQAHLTLLQIRPMLAEFRHTDERDAYADHLDAFDDKLAETADDDLDESEISPDQFVQLCEQVGVLGYLDERLEKHAPLRWAADPAFLDALENLAGQVRGLKAAVLRGQRAPIRAALSDLRRAFDRFYLLYG